MPLPPRRACFYLAFVLSLTAPLSAQEKVDPKPDAEWGSITGRVVWGKEELPGGTVSREVIEKNVDAKHCTQKGDLPNESRVVDPATKGVQNVFVYLRKAEKIHPSYPATKEDVVAKDEEAFKKSNGVPFAEAEAAAKDGKVSAEKMTAPVVLDQQFCRFVPRALVVREGQKVLVKNPEPVAHNLNVQGFGDGNSQNTTMPPKTVLLLNLAAENSPIKTDCNIHGWMTMSMMVVDHPYAVVTGKDGSFALKNVPPGDLEVDVRNSDGLFIAKKLKLTVEAGQVKDVGEVKWTPKD